MNTYLNCYFKPKQQTTGEIPVEPHVTFKTKKDYKIKTTKTLIR